MIISKDGHIIYETLDEIINDGIDMLTEWGNYYYVTSQKDPFIVYVRDHKDENICGSPSIWMADKKTEKVTHFGNYVQYLMKIEDHATPVNIEEFLRERKRRSA